MVKSRGWHLCEQWGGSETTTTPLFLHSSHDCNVIWLSWLSKINKTFMSRLAPVSLMKCCSHLTYKSPLIHPEADAPPIVPGGAPTSKRLLRFLRGKINSGGINTPLALAHTTAVIVSPFQQIPVCQPVSFHLEPRFFAFAAERSTCRFRQHWIFLLHQSCLSHKPAIDFHKICLLQTS